MSLPLDQRLTKLEKKTFRLRWLCGLQAALLVAFWLSTLLVPRVEAQGSAPVLRVRGLVIEDSRGRPRVLLGAPFPQVRERHRQDSTTTALVFLDENGHDRLTLGEEPEPQIGGKVVTTVHRIAPGFGVVIHDGEGNERGAYGWLANGRALITLDRPGLDAWAAIVDDKTGFAGMRVEYAPNVARDSNGIEIGTKGSDAFFRLQDTNEKDRAVLQFGGNGTTTFKTLDGSGKVIRNIALSEPDQ
jgi:hypothetical protein